jgi:hypothetical protein
VIERIGFTGTAQGMSVHQLQQVELLLRTRSDLREFHHGDCVGSDAQAHGIAFQLGVPTIVIHPPIDPKARAYCHLGEQRPLVQVVVQVEKPYLDRNHDIVDSVDLLIATPYTDQEQLRSGTWATVRYARKVGVPVVVISRERR